MLAVDDAHQVLVLGGFQTQHPDELFLQLGHQLVLHLAVHQAVVRGHAGLAGVEDLAKGQALGGEGDVGGLVHDDRALAPQLQVTGVRWRLAFSMTSLPTSTEPVKKM